MNTSLDANLNLVKANFKIKKKIGEKWTKNLRIRLRQRNGKI